ncbi:hypothetical protein PENTCL1PPCAC_30439, partial [Pristionchus entomophagus]
FEIVPLHGGVNTPFLRTVCFAGFFGAIEAFIYYNVKVHRILYCFLKEQEAAKSVASHIQPSTNHSIPAAYQGSYQGYDAQPPLVQ